jgi:hypothetical protein
MILPLDNKQYLRLLSQCWDGQSLPAAMGCRDNDSEAGFKELFVTDGAENVIGYSMSVTSIAKQTSQT